MAHAQPADDKALVREIFRELIDINTTDSVGDNTRAAEAVAARFKAAGFPDSDVQLLVPAPRKGNVIARIHSTEQGKPILLLGHLDVVEARREDWSFDPFKFREEGGYFYGRGTQDMKGDDALLITTFIRLKREGYRPTHDLILALTSDEEGGQHNGVDWLIQDHRDLIDAIYCINADGGGGEIRDGKRMVMTVEAAEKTYASFRLETKNHGGHSSLPEKQNAIYELSDALQRLSQYQFPINLNPATSNFFERMAQFESGQTAADFRAVVKDPPDRAAAARLSETPMYNAYLRTTCVATELSGGHAENALPQSATAIVNCRLVPSETPQQTEATLKEISGPKVTVVPEGVSVPSPASPLRPDVMHVLETVTNQMWPGVPVVPEMATGASDGKWLRIAGIPTYAVSGVFTDINDVRAHGKDERTAVASYYEALEFDYRVVKMLGQTP